MSDAQTYETLLVERHDAVMLTRLDRPQACATNDKAEGITALAEQRPAKWEGP